MWESELGELTVTVNIATLFSISADMRKERELRIKNYQIAPNSHRGEYISVLLSQLVLGTEYFNHFPDYKSHLYSNKEKGGYMPAVHNDTITMCVRARCTSVCV